MNGKPADPPTLACWCCVFPRQSLDQISAIFSPLCTHTAVLYFTLSAFRFIMADLNAYFATASSCTSRRDGAKLAALIALPIENGMNATVKLLIERAKSVSVLSYASSNVPDEGAASIAGFCILALVALGENDFKKAYEHELAAYNSVLEYLKDESTVWILPVLYRISNDLRLIANKADAESNSSDFLRNSLENLTKGFTLIAKDRSSVSTPGSKKKGIFAVTNVLFKIYFKVNTLQLCSKLISVVEGPNGATDNLHLYPVSDVVMYKYYLGRLKLFEDKYEDARDSLRYALKHTPRHAMKDRQRILASLIPVEMCLGVMPTALIASKYAFHEYLTLANAARVGDLKTFEQVMQYAHFHCPTDCCCYRCCRQIRRHLFAWVCIWCSNKSRVSLAVVYSRGFII